MRYRQLICPACRRSTITLYMGGQFGKYQCKRCSYVGSLVLEQEFRQHRRKKNRSKKYSKK